VALYDVRARSMIGLLYFPRVFACEQHCSREQPLKLALLQ